MDFFVYLKRRRRIESRNKLVLKTKKPWIQQWDFSLKFFSKHLQKNMTLHYLKIFDVFSTLISKCSPNPWETLHPGSPRPPPPVPPLKCHLYLIRKHKPSSPDGVGVCTKRQILPSVVHIYFKENILKFEFLEF